MVFPNDVVASRRYCGPNFLPGLDSGLKKGEKATFVIDCSCTCIRQPCLVRFVRVRAGSEVIQQNIDLTL